jgi:nucleotide-binding universal stress UspA family protein
MGGFGNQVAGGIEAIPHSTALSPDADTMKLYGQALAGRYRSECIVLHVVDLGATFADEDSSRPVKIFRVHEEKRLHDLGGKQEMTTPVTNLLETIPDPVLVIGTRGPEDLSRMVLGSTALEYLHQGHMPVLTIGPSVSLPEQPITFQSIVYATDFSPESAKACVSAFSFAQNFGAQVYVCLVRPEPEGEFNLDEEDLHDKFVTALEALVPDASPEWTDPDCVLDYKFAADGILQVARRVKASLIVLGTRRAQRRLHHPTTGLPFQVISGSACPVLSIQG